MKKIKLVLAIGMIMVTFTGCDVFTEKSDITRCEVETVETKPILEFNGQL